MNDALLDELTSVGRVESEGEFSLDRDKARQKMRRFQLADPRSYVLELVQAAVLKDATAMRFDIDPVEMVVSFDGQPFTLEDFDDIYAAVFTRRRDRAVLARKQLALGLNAAMALEPVSITVTSGDGTGRGARLTLLPGEAAHDAFEAVDTELAGTRIALRERFRAGVVVDFFKNLAGEVAEEHHLRRQCVFSQVAIDLEGRRVDRGLHVPGGAIDEVAIEADGIRGVCGFTLDRAASPVIHLVTNGVWITTVSVSDLPPGFVAVIEGRDLHKDVSQRSIVRDDDFTRAVHQVAPGRDLALARLARRLAEGTAPPWAREQLLEVLDQHGASFVERVRQGQAQALVRALFDAPLWRSTRDEPVTVDMLLRRVERGPVAFVSTRIDDAGVLPDGHDIVVRVSTDLEARALAQVTSDRLRDVQRELDWLARREHGRQAWRARPTEAALPMGTWLARRPLAGDRLVGEVGLSRTVRSLSITLVKDGCALETLGLPDVCLGLCAVIEADFTPTEMFDGVHRDTSLARALLVLAGELPALYEDAARTEPAIDGFVTSLFGSLLGGLLATRFRADALMGRVAGLDLGAMGLDALRPPPFDLRLNEETPHAIASVLTYRCTDGSRTSVAEIAAQIRAGGKVPVTRRHDTEPSLRALVFDHVAEQQLTALLGQGWLVDVADDIDRVQAERAFMQRPAVAVDLDGPGIVEHGSREGVLCAVRLQLDAGRAPTRQPIAVHHQGRPIDRVFVVAPAGLDAVVEAPDLTPRPDFSGVARDEALHRALRVVADTFVALIDRLATSPQLPDHAATLRGVAAMAFPTLAMRDTYDAGGHDREATFERDLERSIGELGGGRAPWRRMLIEALFPGADARTPWARRAVAPTGALATAPIYPMADGTMRSLAELVADPSAPVWVLSRPCHTALDAPVVIAAGDDLDALRRMLGTSRLRSGEILVARARNAQHLAATARRLERVVLARGQALVSVPLGVDDAAMTGELGLPVHHDHAPRTPRPLHLTLSRQQRVLAEHTPDAFDDVALVGVVDDARLTMRYDLSGLEEDAALERILLACREAVPRLMQALIALMHEVTGDAWSVGRRHLLDAVTKRLPTDLERWPAAFERAPWLRAACAVEIVPVVGGGFASLNDLREQARRDGHVRCIGPRLDWTHPPAGLDPGPIYLIDRDLQVWLRPLFPAWEVLDTRWHRHRAAEQRRDALPAVRPWPDADVLARLEVDLPGLRGVLVRPRRRGPHCDRVELAVDGKRVATVALPGRLTAAGHLHGPAVHVSPDWNEAWLDPDAHESLQAAVCALYARVADRFEHTDELTAARWLGHAVVALRHGLLGEGLSSAEASLYRRLHELPLLEIPAQRRFVSMATALVEHPPALAHLGLWRAPEPTAEPLPPPAVDANNKPSWQVYRPPPPPPVQRIAPAAPPPPSPSHGQLVESLRQTLRLVRRHNRQLLAELHLERLAVGQGGGDLVARVEAGGVVVDAAHATAAAAFAHPDDPTWLRLLASSVYTALNLAHTEITDTHEVAFHHLLVTG